MTKAQAARAGRALVKKLPGSRWRFKVYRERKPRVGWDYYAYTRKFLMYKTLGGRWTCKFFIEPGLIISFEEYRDTPKEAVAAVLATVRSKLVKLQTAVASADKELGSTPKKLEKAGAGE